MAKIDEYYEFRLATKEDIDNIMLFIKEEWNENHILANDKAFFEYEYVIGNIVNVMLAFDKETNKIACMQGFIRYAAVSSENPKVYIAGALLKATAHGKIPFVGVETQKHLLQQPFVQNFIGNGLNTNTSLVLAKKVFQRKTGKLIHYYILSEQKEYKIANIKNKIISNIADIQQYQLKKYFSIDRLIMDLQSDILEYDTNPYKKDKWYLNKRYFIHPIYQYQIYAIKKQQNLIDGFIIGREQEQFGRKIFRIIDFIGNQADLAHLGKAFHTMLLDENYEYIDFYEYGLTDEYLHMAGFINIKENDENVIPNYFEPFIQKNIDIWWESPIESPIMFKGDGDQDRPCRREINNG